MSAALEMEVDIPNRILLVEDNAANILVMTMFLKELGYSCDVATSGVQALLKFGEGRYALIIMDLNMPEMCGLETTRRIRAAEERDNLPATPIVATTGSASDSDRARCFGAGMNEFLSKPFRLGELETTIRQLTA